METKIHRSYKLSPTVLAALEESQKATGATATAIVEESIMSYWSKWYGYLASGDARKAYRNYMKARNLADLMFIEKTKSGQYVSEIMEILMALSILNSERDIPKDSPEMRQHVSELAEMLAVLEQDIKSLRLQLENGDYPELE